MCFCPLLLVHPDTSTLALHVTLLCIHMSYCLHAASHISLHWPQGTASSCPQLRPLSLGCKYGVSIACSRPCPPVLQPCCSPLSSIQCQLFFLGCWFTYGGQRWELLAACNDSVSIAITATYGDTLSSLQPSAIYFPPCMATCMAKWLRQSFIQKMRTHVACTLHASM